MEAHQIIIPTFRSGQPVGLSPTFQQTNQHLHVHWKPKYQHYLPLQRKPIIPICPILSHPEGPYPRFQIANLWAFWDSFKLFSRGVQILGRQNSTQRLLNGLLKKALRRNGPSPDSLVLQISLGGCRRDQWHMGKCGRIHWNLVTRRSTLLRN